MADEISMHPRFVERRLAVQSDLLVAGTDTLADDIAKAERLVKAGIGRAVAAQMGLKLTDEQAACFYEGR